MALIHADNFSIYGTNPAFMLNGVYAQNDGCTLVTDPDGVSSGHVLQVTANLNTGGARYILPNLVTALGMGQRLWMPTLPTNTSVTPALSWRDIGNNACVTIGCDTTGRLFLSDGEARSGSPIRIATTTSPVVTANAWWHIEGKMSTVTVSTTTTLTYEVRVEGVTVLSGTYVMAHGSVANYAQVLIGCDDFTNTPYDWKDFVIWDTTGSLNNNFLGSVLVLNLHTTSDVSLNWTPSTGTTGYPILSDIPPVDGTYISAAAGIAAYKGGLSDLPTNVTSVKGLITFVRAAKADGGDGSLQNGIISGASTGTGANRPITTAQTYWRDVFETDPATSAAWTVAAVNAANVQINRTT